MNSIQVGDIYYASWGFDQTNIDFYRVMKTNGKSVWLSDMGNTYVNGNSCWAGNVIPDGNVTQNPKEWLCRRIGRMGSHIYIRGESNRYLRKWDGIPKYESHYA